MGSSDDSRSLTAKADAAFARAAARVVRRAQQTGTPIAVWKEALESRPITKSELERFRKNAADWWSKRNRR